MVKGGYSVKSDLGLFLLKLPGVHLQVLERPLNSRFSVGKQMQKTTLREMQLIQLKPLVFSRLAPKGEPFSILKGLLQACTGLSGKHTREKILFLF